MTFADAKKRFSTRVADYARYRPGYPGEVLDLLRAGCGLRVDHVVADIGSGTGLLSELFLENGNAVFGVEPNEAMRRGGEEYLAGCGKFTSVEGSAEATTLPDASVDFVTAGQAFHWFEPEKARAEFRRILRPQGWVVVIWNDRSISDNPFGREYEDLLLRFGTDYQRVKDAYPETNDMQGFFGEGNFSASELSNAQSLDWEGLAGRLRSSSYAPLEGHANFAPMMDALRLIFENHQQQGGVRLEYKTHVYFGQLHR